MAGRRGASPARRSPARTPKEELNGSYWSTPGSAGRGRRANGTSTRAVATPTSVHRTQSSEAGRALVEIAACATFMVAGPALILLNKKLLSGGEGGGGKFPFPIALTAFGPLFTAIVARALLGLGAVRFEQPKLARSWSFYLQSTLPIAVLSGLTLALGNAAYVHLSVATAQILKTLTPAMTLAVSYALAVDRPSARVCGYVLVICMGTAIAAQGDIALPPRGLALQLGANLAEALRVVLSQWLIAKQRLPLLEAQYHVAPSQAGCLLLASLALELRDPASRAALVAAVAARPFAFLAVSALGLVLQFAGLLAIRVLGSVTMKLLGIARSAALVLFEVLRGNEPASLRMIVGYSISLGAFAVYSRLKMKEKQR